MRKSVVYKVLPNIFLITLLLGFIIPTQAREALRICADPGNMPLSNDKQEGFENKIADIVAQAMGTQATYFYRPYLERGLTRQTFDNNECDVLFGMTPDDERMLTTKPLYRSTFVLAYRNDRGLDIQSFDDPKLLNDLKVGVFQHSAIRTVLQERGINRDHTVVRTIAHDADLQPERQPHRTVQQVVDGELDVAAIWGPMAGWYPKKLKAPITIVPVNLWEDRIPLEFSLSWGLRKSAKPLKAEIEKILDQEKDKIRAVLEAYGVPLVACEDCLISGNLPSHGAYQKRVRPAAKDLPPAEMDLASIEQSVNAALQSGNTLGSELFSAVLANQPAKIDYLIGRKADLNSRDTQNQTATMVALNNGHEDIVIKLLKAGADSNAADNDGWTLAMHAAWKNEPKVIRQLGVSGAKLELLNKDLMTALAYAAEFGKTQAAVALLDVGAKPDTRAGAAHFTPLMLSALAGTKPVTQVLLQYQANPNLKNDSGYTALMMAAAKNHVDQVHMLLRAGADTSMRSPEKKTALEMALENEATQAAEAIQQYLDRNKP